MNKIALGTAQFGQTYGVANYAERLKLHGVRSILELASANGIHCLDTAVSYGDSESVLGSAGVDAFDAISKLPPIPDRWIGTVAAWVDSQVRGSLDRLRITRLDGLLLHHPAQLLSPIGEQLYRALEEQVDRGRVRRIGISIYDPSELDLLIPRFRWDLVQAPMNILDARLSRSGWVCRLQDSGVALHLRSIFLQGLLLMPAYRRPSYFDRWLPLWDAWDSWLSMSQLTPLQACLRYALQIEGVERIVLGVDSNAQLTEILSDAVGGPLPDGYLSLQTEDSALLNPSLWKIE